MLGFQYSFLINAEKQPRYANVTWRYREVLGSEIDVLNELDFKVSFAFGGYRGNYVTLGVGNFINENLSLPTNHDFGILRPHSYQMYQ